MLCKGCHDMYNVKIPGGMLCEDCHAMYNVMRNEGVCPKCRSRRKKILGGREFRVREIRAAEG